MIQHTTPEYLHRGLRAVLMGAALLLASGCILRLTGGFAFTNDLVTFVDFIFEDVSTAYCTEVRDPATGNTVVECLYSIVSEELGFSQRTSTAELISEFGLFGLLVDPLIVQVREDAEHGVATVDDGTGPQNLRITETTSFDVQPGVQSTAEAGHKFWIIELPEALESALPADLTYSFPYRSPAEPDGITTIKAMYTGRVEVNGNTFYIPLYPCTPDFSQVPQIDIDVSASGPPGRFLGAFIFALQLQFGLGDELGCRGEIYDFSAVSANAPPDVDAGPDTTIDEGERFLSAGSFIDADSSSWTAMVDYGDGTTPQTLPLDMGAFALDHIYVDDGVFTVTVTVTDDQGNVGTDTTVVTVNNVAPTVDAGPDDTIDQGETFFGTGSFTDPGDDTWTATVDYGDGTVQTQPLNADKTFPLSHTYSSAGIFVVTVEVSDDDGGVGSDSATVTVNEVAPPLTCDIDMDGDVDRDDISLILAARNQPVSGPDDLRDNDGDGVITVLDARQCVLLCTRSACATE